MSDEAMEEVLDSPPHGKTYDIAAYLQLCDSLQQKAKGIGYGFTARDVEMALYSHRHGTVAGAGNGLRNVERQGEACALEPIEPNQTRKRHAKETSAVQSSSGTVTKRTRRAEV